MAAISDTVHSEASALICEILFSPIGLVVGFTFPGANGTDFLWSTSPEQFAGWLKHSYAVNKDYQVSHEIIYRSLYIQARGALKKELLEHLRRTRAMRRSRHHTMKTEDHGRIYEAVSISERPATAEDRAIPGH